VVILMLRPHYRSCNTSSCPLDRGLDGDAVKKREISAPAGNQTLIARSSSPWSSHCTDRPRSGPESSETAALMTTNQPVCLSKLIVQVSLVVTRRRSCALQQIALVTGGDMNNAGRQIGCGEQAVCSPALWRISG
jgi:hypothetical protein